MSSVTREELWDQHQDCAEHKGSRDHVHSSQLQRSEDRAGAFVLKEEWGPGCCLCFKGVDGTFGDKKKSRKELRPHPPPDQAAP